METYGTAVVPQATLTLHGDERNYEEWEVRMKTYLLSQDLWKDVQQTDEPLPGRGRQNFMALHVIQNSCSTQAFSVIKDLSLAREAWKALKDQCRGDQDTQEVNMSEENLNNFARLYEAVREGRLGDTKSILDSSDANILLTQRIPDKGETALHTAVTNGHEHIVAELVSRILSYENLAMHDSDGYTALITAAVLGKKEMVDCMLREQPDLISVRSESGEKNLPVFMAINSGQIEMARYLFHRYHITNSTQINKIDNREDATRLLTQAIYTKTLGIRGILPSTRPDPTSEIPLYVIPSGDQSNQENQNNRSPGMGNPSTPLTSQTHLNGSNEEQWQSNINREEYQRIKQLYEMKKIHELYDELLQSMYTVISRSSMKQLDDGLVFTAICRAVKNGIFEFVSKILEMDRRFLWIEDRNERNIFMLAVLHRQEKIFRILRGLDEKMICPLTSKPDVYGNNMLHMAGMIEDSSSVNQIPGEAMQMQRELQWFKEVERIVPPNAKEKTNEDGLTPQKLFTKNHKDMMEKGEKWMKSTASSCSVVGALIVTIVFAATFTLPGGNKQDTGLPNFLKDKRFRVFMIFDALSFFLSLTSVSMFLGILTSRYAEDDFLVSLPWKMKIGLFTLFCSIVTMMITFSSALLIILDETLYIAIPLICLAGFPVTCFLGMQFPILKDMIKSDQFLKHL